MAGDKEGGGRAVGGVAAVIQGERGTCQTRRKGASVRQGRRGQVSAPNCQIYFGPDKLPCDGREGTGGAGLRGGKGGTPRKGPASTFLYSLFFYRGCGGVSGSAKKLLINRQYGAETEGSRLWLRDVEEEKKEEDEGEQDEEERKKTGACVGVCLGDVS